MTKMDLSDLLDQIGSKQSSVAFDPKDMPKELLAYGEQEAAEKLPKLDKDSINKIGILAYKHYSDFEGESGPMLDTAICLAIVEFLEGKARPLKRKRRVYK